MFEDGLNSREENKINYLLNRFNEMLDSAKYLYFDSHDIEKIIDFYIENSNKAKIKDAFSLYEKLFPFSSKLKIKKAQTLLYFDKASDAYEVIKEVPSLNNDEYLYTLAVIYSKLNKNKKAISIFEDLLISNNNEELLSILANEYQKIDNYSKSADMLERLLLMYKADEINWYSYIVTCEISKNSSRSLSFIKNYLKSKPYDHTAWFYLGIVHQRIDNHLDAIEAFEYSICIKENYINAYTSKSESLSELGYYNKAIDCYEESFNYSEPDAYSYFDIGKLYEKMDNLEKAKSYFYKSIRKEEDFAEAWYAVALILDLQDQHLEASYHIKKAVDINSSNIDFLFVYAQINEKIGLIKEAEIAYRKVLELDELDSESWLNYSQLLYKNESINKAIEVLQKGVKLNPKNAKLSYRLSVYLFQSGSENQALSMFEKALSIDYDLHKEVFKYFPSIKDNKNLLNLLIEYKK